MASPSPVPTHVRFLTLRTMRTVAWDHDWPASADWLASRVHRPAELGPNYFLALRFYSRLPHRHGDQKVFDLLSFLESGIQPSGRAPRPAQVSPSGPRYSAGTFFPLVEGRRPLPLAKEAIEPPINANSAQQAPHDAPPLSTPTGVGYGIRITPKGIQFEGHEAANTAVEQSNGIFEIRHRARVRRACPVVTQALELCVSCEK
jgi:hypothetical protein